MAEFSYPWSGTGVGDAVLAPYDAETAWAEVLGTVSDSLGATPWKSGIIQDDTEQYIPTPGVGFVTIGSGRSIVYGTLHRSSVSQSVLIPTPSVSTRVDLIVLRKSWAAKTVRITRIAGIEGVLDPPAHENTAGVTWDMPLCSVTVTTIGGLTIQDFREYANGGALPLSQFLMPRYPAVCMLRNVGAANLVTPDVTYTRVSFNTEVYKSHQAMHNPAVDPQEIFIVQNGLYELSAGFTWEPDPGGVVRIIQFYRNGVAFTEPWMDDYITPSSTGLAETRAAPAAIRLIRGDVIEMYVYQDSGGPLTNPVQGHGWIQVKQVAP